MSTALLIVAHGSHLDANSSLPARRHAEAIRSAGDFDEVRTAFWKEEPALSRAFDGCQADEAIVVPFFMADGYFTRTVIPRELALDAPRQAPPHRITLTPPVGLDERIPALLRDMAHAVGATAEDTVAILGHGTNRNATSAAAALTHAASPALAEAFAAVTAVYLDQEPSIGTLRDRPWPGRTFLVPLFVSNGWHVGTSIPEEMENVGAGRFILTNAVGEDPRMAPIIREAALATRSPA